ncbi:SET domain-containing protein [Trametes polyzona]|nr:SET domain-containing protein [Trametes polyzona]
MALQPFVRWLEENKIDLHERIDIVQTDDRGVAVVSTSDEPILHPQTVASIPKPSILSVRSCSLSEQIQGIPYGHGAVLSLSLALYSEILSGNKSRWRPYLQSLPASTVPIARLWGDSAAFPNDADAQEASLWIHGTDVQREIQDDDGSLLMDETRAYYRDEVQPLLDPLGLSPTLQGFLHAYSLVCSRAFLVDAYHGLSMVPVADAFNHTHENHVQMASEFDVCPICGSFSECPHDGDETPSAQSSARSTHVQSTLDQPDTVDMVTVRSIPPRAEIYNTYGANLGNAALLARYGFALEGGDTDSVSFGWPGSGIVPDDDEEKDTFRTVYSQVHEKLGDAVQRSGMLFVPDDVQPGRLVVVNSDGQVSLGLFLWAVWHALSERPPPSMEGHSDIAILATIPHVLPPVVNMLIQIETYREEGNGVYDVEGENADYVEVRSRQSKSCDNIHRSRTSYLKLLGNVAEAIASLCRTRIASMGKKGYRGASAEVLGELLDKLPPESTKTKLAVEYLLSERALLEACAVGWEELRAMITSGSDVDSGSDMES